MTFSSNVNNKKNNIKAKKTKIIESKYKIFKGNSSNLHKN